MSYWFEHCYECTEGRVECKQTTAYPTCVRMLADNCEYSRSGLCTCMHSKDRTPVIVSDILYSYELCAQLKCPITDTVALYILCSMKCSRGNHSGVHPSLASVC